MHSIRLGDRVRIDIPNESDPDFAFHGRHGIVISRNEVEVTVGFEGQDIVLDVSPADIRPPIDSKT